MIISMCPNHVFVVKCIIHREAFVRFELEGTVTFGVKMETLYNAISKSAKSDRVTLTLKDDHEPIIITLEDLQGSKNVKYKIEQTLITSGDRIEIPDIEWKCEVLIFSPCLMDVIKQLKGTSENVKLTITEEEIAFHSRGPAVSSKVRFSFSKVVLTF